MKIFYSIKYFIKINIFFWGMKKFQHKFNFKNLVERTNSSSFKIEHLIQLTKIK
jgi:hypothetical protein